MPANWQRYIPFEIDRFFGSAAVQAMSGAAQMGYWRLICAQWQSDECMLDPDPFNLAEKSGLGDELWAILSPRILRQFETLSDDNGALRNRVCFEIWTRTRTAYQRRAHAAEKTNERRSPSRSPSRNGTVTDTVTVGENAADRHGDRVTPSLSQSQSSLGVSANSNKKQKPSGAKSAPAAEGEEAQKPPTKTALAKGRHAEFKAILGEYWTAANRLEMPWDGREGKALEVMLRASPNLSADQFRQLLRNRFRSARNHSERPSIWLPFVTSYGNGPIDRFGQPADQGPAASQPKTLRAEGPANDSEAYETWLSMSDRFREENPWKGEVPE